MAEKSKIIQTWIHAGGDWVVFPDCRATGLALEPIDVESPPVQCIPMVYEFTLKLKCPNRWKKNWYRIERRMDGRDKRWKRRNEREAKNG